MVRDPDVLALSEVVALALVVRSGVHKVARAVDLLTLRGSGLDTTGVNAAGTGGDHLTLSELPRASTVGLAHTARTNILVTCKEGNERRTRILIIDNKQK